MLVLIESYYWAECLPIPALMQDFCKHFKSIELSKKVNIFRNNLDSNVHNSHNNREPNVEAEFETFRSVLSYETMAKDFKAGVPSTEGL